MRFSVLVLAAVVMLGLSHPSASLAQATNTDATTKSTKSRAAKPKREPTVGQMAARERQKKCGAEWREAKQKGTTGGLKWPQYWSKCNARLKGNQV